MQNDIAEYHKRYKDFEVKLSDWVDEDIAQYYVGLCIGIIPEGTPYEKATYWSNTPLGNATHLMLLGMVHSGMLFRRTEPDYQYKWNDKYYEQEI
jgi:hypothetical protein